jgi:hypothetical protein
MCWQWNTRCTVWLIVGVRRKLTSLSFSYHHRREWMESCKAGEVQIQRELPGVFLTSLHLLQLWLGKYIIVCDGVQRSWIVPEADLSIAYINLFLFWSRLPALDELTSLSFSYHHWREWMESCKPEKCRYRENCLVFCHILTCSSSGHGYRRYADNLPGLQQNSSRWHTPFTRDLRQHSQCVCKQGETRFQSNKLRDMRKKGTKIWSIYKSIIIHTHKKKEVNVEMRAWLGEKEIFLFLEL